ncbi:MAG: hypothetical protein H0X51_02700 [Parachlamydiaceae bacterium]|nr:hypothetical protein [Parachlamydiaceae bacterium]
MNAVSGMNALPSEILRLVTERVSDTELNTLQAVSQEFSALTREEKRERIQKKLQTIAENLGRSLKTADPGLSLKMRRYQFEKSFWIQTALGFREALAEVQPRMDYVVKQLSFLSLYHTAFMILIKGVSLVLLAHVSFAIHFIALCHFYPRILFEYIRSSFEMSRSVMQITSYLARYDQAVELILDIRSLQGRITHLSEQSVITATKNIQQRYNEIIKEGPVDFRIKQGRAEIVTGINPLIVT